MWSLSICRLLTYNAHLVLSSFNRNFSERALVFLPRENWLASAKHLLGSRRPESFGALLFSDSRMYTSLWEQVYYIS